jgi:hypothetical protein
MLLVLALAWPRSLTHVYRLWMTVGEVLGWINTRIILGVLFYLLFTPLGLCMRLRGKDVLSLTRRSDLSSYWITRDQAEVQSMKNQF